jgi:hypothetical protein
MPCTRTGIPLRFIPACDGLDTRTARSARSHFAHPLIVGC